MIRYICQLQLRWYTVPVGQYTFTHKSAGRAPSLQVLPWHLPYKWGKSTEKLSQGNRRVLAYILPKSTHYKIHTYTQTHTLQKPHAYTHTLQNPHITKQFKTTTVQMKTNTIQDRPKWNSHNIIKYPQYKVNDNFIHKNFTVTHFTSLNPQKLHRKSLHFTTHFTLLHYSLHSLSLSSQLTVYSVPHETPSEYVVDATVAQITFESFLYCDSGITCCRRRESVHSEVYLA